MAIVLSSPKYSFVQLFEQYNDSCGAFEQFALPVYDLKDLEFQMTALVDGTDKTTFLAAHVNAGITIDCVTPGILVQNWIGTWTQTETGAGVAPDTWVGNFKWNTNTLFTGLSIGQCFNIVFYKQSDGLPVTDCTYTTFQKIQADCFTSVIEYRNNSNAFYFDYSSSLFFNRVRLPFYLHSPTFDEERQDYKKSDGSTKQLMFRIWKDYKVKTDYFLQDWLEKFQVATTHDGIYITDTYNNFDTKRVLRIDKIDFSWIEDEKPFVNIAQAKTTFRIAEAVQNVSSNCS